MRDTLIDIAATLLVIGAVGSAVLFIITYFYARRAGKLFDKADSRVRFVTNEMTEAGLLAKEFNRGFHARDGEIRWYAVKWEGENERANLHTVVLEQWESQLENALKLVDTNPELTAKDIIAVLLQLVEQGRDVA